MLATLLAIPISSFARFKNFIRTNKGFKVADGQNRKDTKIKYGSVTINFLKVSQKDTDKDIGIFKAEASGKGGARLHVHHEQDKILIIMEGKFRILVGDDKFDASVGDTVFLLRKAPYILANITEGKSKAINIYQPTGQMEAFFQLLGT